LIYPKNTIYITGTAKVAANDPISAMYDMFFVGLIVEKESGKIVDVTCNMVRDVTSDFIKSILINYNLVEDIELIVEEVKERFLGIAQKAVIAAVKDARNKYLMAKND